MAAVSQNRSYSLNNIGGSDAEQVENLTAAFQFFNKTSEQLANSYAQLEKRVQEMAQELDKTHQEKKSEHQAKQKIANQMQALLEFLPGGVIVLDGRGVIVEANPAANSLLDAELKGRVWRNIINECFAPRNDDGFEVSTRSGRRISISTGAMNAEGQIILLTDQTETRRLQENLSRHEKLSAIGKMVSALAHQIRTPLSAAMLYAGHMCDSSIAQPKKDIFAQKLYGRLRHMEKQVRDMLFFVKSELPLNDCITLSDLMNGLRQAAELELKTSKSHCSWDNSAEDLKIKCNRESLISALMNLINNSIQAENGEADIRIHFSKASGTAEEVSISISDKGPGMTDEELNKALELFYTSKPQGTGLGLSVVQSVAKAHGGKFNIDSKPQQGTTCTLTLPVSNCIKNS